MCARLHIPTQGRKNTHTPSVHRRKLRLKFHPPSSSNYPGGANGSLCTDLTHSPPFPTENFNPCLLDRHRCNENPPVDHWPEISYIARSLETPGTGRIVKRYKRDVPDMEKHIHMINKICIESMNNDPCWEWFRSTCQVLLQEVSSRQMSLRYIVALM